MEVDLKNPILEFLPNTVVILRKIYNLENERIVQSVDILEDWVRKQNHFLNKNFSRRYLETTIIACKGSVEKAKTQIDKLCTYKTLLSKFFISSGIKQISENVNQIAIFLALPKMTKNHQRACIVKFINKPQSSSILLDYFRLCIVLAEYLKAHDYVDGFIMIEDFREVNLMDFITKVNIMELQQFVTILTEGFGARLKGIHHLSNQSKYLEILVNTVKSVFTEKIANRFHLHQDNKDLHKYVEKEILPCDYGGEERSIVELQAEWTKVLSSEDNEKYLEITRTSGTDESQRRTDKLNDQYMGLPGSFRTLSVD